MVVPNLVTAGKLGFPSFVFLAFEAELFERIQLMVYQLVLIPSWSQGDFEFDLKIVMSDECLSSVWADSLESLSVAVFEYGEILKLCDPM